MFHTNHYAQACVLVTIYRRESDLFALLLRESRDFYSGGKGGGGGRLTVLCDMTLDDAVHLEPQSTPLVVKVVNTCKFYVCVCAHWDTYGDGYGNPPAAWMLKVKKWTCDGLPN